MRTLAERGLDLVDISLCMDTDEAEVPWNDRGFPEKAKDNPHISGFGRPRRIAEA